MSLLWAARRPPIVAPPTGTFIETQRFGDLNNAYDASQGYQPQRDRLINSGPGFPGYQPWNARSLYGTRRLELDDHGLGLIQQVDLSGEGAQYGIWKEPIGNADMHFKMLAFPDRQSAGTDGDRTKAGGVLRCDSDGSVASSLYLLTYDVIRNSVANQRRVGLHLVQNDTLNPVVLHESVDLVGLTRSGGNIVDQFENLASWLYASIVDTLVSWEIRDTDDTFVISSGTFDTSGDAVQLSAGTNGGIVIDRAFAGNANSQPWVSYWSAGPGHWN